MKCNLDFCRIHYLNKEFLPNEYSLKWRKSESRFTRFFESLFEDDNSQGFDIPSNSIKAMKMKQNNNKKRFEGNMYPETLLQAKVSYAKSSESPYKNFEGSKNVNITHKTSDIDIAKILTQEDKRTTLMIKNIPNKFSKDTFLDIFNSKFEGKFDLFLIPTDGKGIKNYGYAFINFSNPLYIAHFYYTFNGKKWANTNSVKICEIVYSKIQGVSKIVKHYPSKVMFLKNTNQEKKTAESYIEIPKIYQGLFSKIYPSLDVTSNSDEDVFYIDKEKLLQK